MMPYTTCAIKMTDRICIAFKQRSCTADTYCSYIACLPYIHTEIIYTTPCTGLNCECCQRLQTEATACRLAGNNTRAEVYQLCRQRAQQQRIRQHIVSWCAREMRPVACDVDKPWCNYAFIQIPVTSAEKQRVVQFLRAQQGKPYDHMSTTEKLGLLVKSWFCCAFISCWYRCNCCCVSYARNSISSRRRWNCNDLVQETLRQIPRDSDTITPTDMYYQLASYDDAEHVPFDNMRIFEHDASASQQLQQLKKELQPRSTLPMKPRLKHAKDDLYVKHKGFFSAHPKIIISLRNI